MKKLLVSVASILLVMIIWLGIYQIFFSFSTVLRQHDFTKNHIITSKGFTIDDKHLSKMHLVADQERIAIMAADKKWFGLWGRSNNESMQQNNSEGKFAINSFVNMRLSNKSYYSEIHIFLASYIDEDVGPVIPQPDSYYLNAEFFEADGKNMMFVHAIAGAIKTSFGSDEIISYLEQYVTPINY